MWNWLIQHNIEGSLDHWDTWAYLAYSVGIMSRFIKKPKVSHLTATKRILRYIKESMDCFKHMIRKKIVSYLDTLALINVVTRMIENQQQSISFYTKKHQSLGIQEKKHLWHYHHVKLSTLHHLYVFGKLCGWWICYKNSTMISVMRCLCFLFQEFFLWSSFYIYPKQIIY